MIAKALLAIEGGDSEGARSVLTLAFDPPGEIL